MTDLKYILTIGGLDPSSGAGITSDIKTFEAHGLHGLSVCTAITVQNDNTFKSCCWVDYKTIEDQIEILFERFVIDVVKIGIIENWLILANLLTKIHQLRPEIRIIVDPIIKSSTGFDFHQSQPIDYLDQVLKKCHLLTPNYEEIQMLYPNKSVIETIDYIKNFTNLYLKGGHRLDKKGYDELYYDRTKVFIIEPNIQNISPKHGSGCVLSAAIASNLSLNFNLKEACKNAKYYTEEFLNSTTSLLGHHWKTTSL